MTPIITLWPEESLHTLASEVSSSLASADYGENVCHRIDCCEESSEETAVMIHDAYRKMVTLNSSDPTLHAIAVIPLYVDTAPAMAEKLIKAIADAGVNVSLDIIGLQSGIRTVLDPSIESNAPTTQMGNIHTIMGLINEASFTCSLMPLDDFAANGVTVGFSPKLLAHFLVSLFSALIENYNSIIMPQIGAEMRHNLLAFGLARLEFNRKEVTDYLVHRTFVAALERDGITVDNIDIQSASQRAIDSLSGIKDLFNQFYDNHVQPLIDQKLNASQIAASLSDPMDQFIDELTNRLTSFFNDTSLSLPEKEATLALILGRDNRRLKGSLYRHDGLIIDDALETPAELFIDTYNRHAQESGLLNKRGDYAELAYPDIDINGTICHDKRNDEAFFPLRDIKRIKDEVIDLTSYIRTNTERFEKLLNNIDEEKIASGHLSSGGFVVQGLRKHHFNSIPEQPLEQTYRPINITPAQSVDLRKFFSDIRDQKDIGSCSSFATISMYEYLINRTQPDLKLQLSEGFLFYKTNVLSGTVEQGSNYFEQIAAMGKFGSCVQALYPYNSDDVNITPTEDAVEDALKHRIVDAKQLPLENGANKYNSLQKNHLLITSALTEGYPVGISLKLFDDFGTQENGFVPRPTDKQIANGNKVNHAMVIVGYSNQNKCYIVRNSWGKSWGDNGYCYISSAYIDDAELNNFACIVTETIEGTFDPNEKAPALIAPFSGTNSQIAAASIRNALDESEIHLQSLTSMYEAYYRYYQDLLTRLSNPITKNRLQQIETKSISDALENAETQRSTLVDEHPNKLKYFCQKYITRAAYCSLISFVIVFAVALMAYYDSFAAYQVYYSGIALLLAVICVIMWGNYKFVRSKKRRELDEEINDAAQHCHYLKEKLTTTHLRYHVAGMIIDKVFKLIDDFDDSYRRIVSYNNNLRCWYDEDKKLALEIEENTRATITNREAMFVSLTNPDVLDKFFAENKKSVIHSIDFIKTFRDYTLSTTSMQAVRDKLEEETRKSLESHLKEFKMIDYLMHTASYSFVPKIDTAQTIQLLNRLAIVLTRNNDTASTNESRFVVINCEHTMLQQWRNTINPLFFFPPMNCNCQDTDILTVVTLKCLDVDMVG